MPAIYTKQPLTYRTVASVAMTASSSASPRKRPPPPPGHGLPTLSLVGPHLRLGNFNEAAVDALQPKAADDFSATEWLRVGDDEVDAHAILDRLVQDSRAYRWGQNDPPILKYRSVGPTPAAAEVLVSATRNQSDETVYTLTLIRPATPPETNAVGPGPPRRFASRVPPQLDTVAAAAAATGATAPISISSSPSGVPPPPISPLYSAA